MLYVRRKKTLFIILFDYYVYDDVHRHSPISIAIAIRYANNTNAMNQLDIVYYSTVQV